MKYYVNSQQFDTDSQTNLRIISQLVDREVFCCMTSEIEYILSRAGYGDSDYPFDDEDTEFGCKKRCEKCGSVDDFIEINTYGLPADNFYTDDDGFYICPICDCGWDILEEARDCCSHETIARCNTCNRLYNEIDYDYLDDVYPEIFEWWAVSNWLGEKLKEQNQVVIESYGKSYWGRQTTGQSISLDSCMANIALGMEILEGQSHQW